MEKRELIALRGDDFGKIPIWKKVNLTIKEAAEYSNIGINRIESSLSFPLAVLGNVLKKRKL